MTSRERLLTALRGGCPDRLPVTTHHLMPYFLDTYVGGISTDAFFQRFGLDPVTWAYDVRPDPSAGARWSAASPAVPASPAPPAPPPSVPPPPPPVPTLPPQLSAASAGGARWIVSDDWRVEVGDVRGGQLRGGEAATRYDIVTPGGTMSMVMRYGPQTDWVLERPLKAKSQIELFQRYAPVPLVDVEAVNLKAEALGGRGILRGAVPGFEIYGQPGCWQDAAELFGIVELILATFDDPGWVHDFLGILRDRKLAAVRSMEGARLDLIELGGGSASSTVISPDIFEEFVAPYDHALIVEAHRVGHRVVYHTCGGMMPLLEQIADMGPDAMETFTPPAMGGDADLREAKERIGDRVCMIGGFDQFHHFQGCTPAETRQVVRHCFESAGEGGGFILSPLDHFFDADVELIRAFAEEARGCVYDSSGHSPEA